MFQKLRSSDSLTLSTPHSPSPSLLTHSPIHSSSLLAHPHTPPPHPSPWRALSATFASAGRSARNTRPLSQGRSSARTRGGESDREPWCNGNNDTTTLSIPACCSASISRRRPAAQVAAAEHPQSWSHNHHSDDVFVPQPEHGCFELFAMDTRLPPTCL